MADRIEPLLREGARAAELASGGTMTPEQARSYLSSFATDALGTPAQPDAAPSVEPVPAA